MGTGNATGGLAHTVLSTSSASWTSSADVSASGDAPKSLAIKDTRATARRVAPTTDPLAPIGFRTIGPIAAGAFSTVVRAIRRAGGEEVAVKSFNRAKYQKAGWLKGALKNEIDVLQTLQPSGHDHIANIIELHDTHHATHAILEYCAGGSVHRHLRSLRHGQALTEAHGAPSAGMMHAALTEGTCAHRSHS